MAGLNADGGADDDDDGCSDSGVVYGDFYDSISCWLSGALLWQVSQAKPIIPLGGPLDGPL